MTLVPFGLGGPGEKPATTTQQEKPGSPGLPNSSVAWILRPRRTGTQLQTLRTSTTLSLKFPKWKVSWNIWMCEILIFLLSIFCQWSLNYPRHSFSAPLSPCSVWPARTIGFIIPLCGSISHFSAALLPVSKLSARFSINQNVHALSAFTWGLWQVTCDL